MSDLTTMTPAVNPDRDGDVLLEERLANVVRSYDAQGDHRTGSATDCASADWLSRAVEACGLQANLESFALERLDPAYCHLRLGNRRIDGMPLLDGGQTPSTGVRGQLGTDESPGAIVLTLVRTGLPGHGEHRGGLSLDELRRRNVGGIVAVTRGKREGLSLMNASNFGTPFGPPVLQVSSVEERWLVEQATARAPATLTVGFERHNATAYNVCATVAGTQPDLPSVVVSTPRSGWWQCASERGGGLACWVETLRALTKTRPRRDCHFVAFSGHELGLLGVKNYLARQPERLLRTHAWIHFGANLGAPRQGVRLQAADPALAGNATSFLRDAGVSDVEHVGPDVAPRGEAGVLKQQGVRFIAPICASDVFHHPSDRWPEAVDIAALARIAKAFVAMALHLAAET